MQDSLKAERVHKPLTQLTAAERLNFILTNRLPRIPLTHFVGWLSRIENPLIASLSISLWRAFVDDLRLEEASTRKFRSLHECFTRELKPGARPVCADPDVLVSPCDAIVGAFGDVHHGQVYQAKGFPYTIGELFGDGDAEGAWSAQYGDGRYVTLRLKSSMYHRFHAPLAGRLGDIRYISGDTWNVNPVALKVIERLYCRNERAVLRLDPEEGARVVLVAVAAILVASMRIHGLDEPLDLHYRGPNHLPLNRNVEKGEELGWFQHGSTIVLFTTNTFRICDEIVIGQTVRMGQPLMQR